MHEPQILVDNSTTCRNPPQDLPLREALVLKKIDDVMTTDDIMALELALSLIQEDHLMTEVSTIILSQDMIRDAQNHYLVPEKRVAPPR